MPTPEPRLRVALAGSGDLPVDRVVRHVVPHLAKARLVLLRRPKSPNRAAGEFERTIARLARPLGVQVVWCAPEGNDRGQSFLRDLDMVTKADYVVGFFSVPTLDGGTGHVIEAAMSKGIPCEAWYVDADGQIERIGEYNPFTDGP